MVTSKKPLKLVVRVASSDLDLALLAKVRALIPSKNIFLDTTEDRKYRHRNSTNHLALTPLALECSVRARTMTMKVQIQITCQLGL